MSHAHHNHDHAHKPRMGNKRRVAIAMWITAGFMRMETVGGGLSGSRGEGLFPPACLRAAAKVA